MESKSIAEIESEETLVNRQDQAESEADAVADQITTKKWSPPASDDDDDPDKEFSVEAAWNALFNLKSTQKIMIGENLQRRLHNVVGINISQEFPWKQIKYRFLRDILFDEIPEGNAYREAFSGFNPEHYVLIGYAPILTQNLDEVPREDPFIFFLDTDDAKTALGIIRNIELYERFCMNKRIVKKPKRWVTLGSEDEVNLTLQQRYSDPIDVEIQSVYPLTIPANKKLSLRKCSDVRDGYVELVPGDSTKFDNVIRRRVTVGVQSAPELVDIGQQTDPTFPTNAWTQYLYEIKEGEDGLDESSADEEETKTGAKEPRPSKTPTPSPAGPETPKPPPEISENIKLLLSALEFNQIDMYRNDYPDISTKEISHYTNPYLEETLCFADIAKSHERYVCGIDWYPAQAGLFVASYTFDTPSTVESLSHRVDTVQRAVLEPNPILMWSFSDNLNYKLVFESPVETTVMSFCPQNPNLLFGGTKNGQIIIWDLQNRVQKLDQEEVLTSAQSSYRLMVGEFLKSTIQINEDIIVQPAIITDLEVSHKAPITGIYWMGRKFHISQFGKLSTDSDPNANHNCFVTSSFDGTFMFWDLNSVQEKKKQGFTLSRKGSKALMQSVSPYKNKVLKPIYQVGFNDPIIGIFADFSVFGCKPSDPPQVRKNRVNFRTELVVRDPVEMRQSLIVATFYGRIERLNWQGLYTNEDTCEKISISTGFARVHDGPIVAMKRNPFYPKIFVTIGKTVFAVWKEDYNYSAIFWRKRPCDLTAVAWSESRPAVLFITRIDGNLEAWDILARDDDACLDVVLGGGIITLISEHRPKEPEKLLGIGDYNSSFRMVRLPPSFYESDDAELSAFKSYIKKEETRKKSMQDWEQRYYEANRDIIEAKRQAEVEARKEMERLEKEHLMNLARKAKEEAEKAAAPPPRLPYTERMKREWDELNMNRLLHILMSRKRVDAEQMKRDTVLEKRRLAYEAAKKESLVQTLQRVGEELANIRARILPAEKPDQQRADMINAVVDHIMAMTPGYDAMEAYADDFFLHFSEFKPITYVEFLGRGEDRRLILNKSLGGITMRFHWYDRIKGKTAMDECNWGYEDFVNAHMDLLAKQRSVHSDDISSKQISSEDIDLEHEVEEEEE